MKLWPGAAAFISKPKNADTWAEPQTRGKINCSSPFSPLLLHPSEPPDLLGSTLPTGQDLVELLRIPQSSHRRSHKPQHPWGVCWQPENEPNTSLRHRSDSWVLGKAGSSFSFEPWGASLLRRPVPPRSSPCSARSGSFRKAARSWGSCCWETVHKAWLNEAPKSRGLPAPEHPSIRLSVHPQVTAPSQRHPGETGPGVSAPFP